MRTASWMMNGDLLGSCQGQAWVLALAWATLAVALLLALVSVAKRRPPDLLRLLSLGVGSLVLRLALASWGPGGGAAPSCTQSVLWRALGWVLPASDTGVVAVHLIAGAIAPTLLTLLLLNLRATTLTAYGAGILLATQPVAVRFSGDQSSFSMTLSLGLLALLLLARHGRAGALWSLPVLVAATLLCLASDPQAAMLLPLATALVLLVHASGWGDLRRAARLHELAAIGAAWAIWLMFAPPGAGQGTIDPAQLSFRHALWLDPGYTPLATIALAAVGALVALGASTPHHRRIAGWSFAALIATALARAPGPSHPLILAHALPQLFPMLMFCILAALGAQELLERVLRRWGPGARVPATVLMALGVAGGGVDPLLNVCRPVTVDQEYEFLARTLPTLPSCAVIYRPFARHVDLGGALSDPDSMAVNLGRKPWRSWPIDGGDGACVRYFYRSPLCSLAPAYAASHRALALPILRSCADGWTATSERPRKVTQVDGRRWGAERYTRDRFDIGFYEVLLPDEATRTR